jgi:hypothetical protein
MKSYLVHPIGEQPAIVRADTLVIEGTPVELRFFLGPELVENFYLHALRKPVRELSEDEAGPPVLEPSVRGDW